MTSAADQQGSAGHERDATPGPHRPCPVPTVERRTRRLVSGGATGARDARRRRRHQGVVELTQQRLQPPVGRHAVGVHERDERGLHKGHARVARPGRADVGGQPHEACAVPLCDLLCGSRIGRRIVDHHARQAREGAEESVQLRRPVAHRHHDRHVVVSELSARCLRNVRASGDQSPRQQLGPPSGPHHMAGPPSLDQLPSVLGNPEQAEWAASEQHGPAVEFPRRRVLGQREGAGQRRGGRGRGGAQRGGHSGCAGLGHRSILAVRGRG